MSRDDDDFVVYVSDLMTAQTLRSKRLLTSSLRFEPSFKHDVNLDDPDADETPDLTTKKGRKVAKFSFEKLLPLKLTREEALCALDLKLIVLEAVKVGNQSQSRTFLAKLRNEETLKQDDVILECSQVISKRISFKDRVFRDLWSRGFCMVDGLKFGVDYLVYARDPLRHHADYMVLIVTQHLPYGSNLDLSTLCAVAAKAKKTLLLASVCSTDNSDPTYMKLKREPVLAPAGKKQKLSKAGED